MHSSSSYNGGFLYRKLSYDGATAFAPVIRCAISGLYIISSATLPVNNVKELVALAKRRPNERNNRPNAANRAEETLRTSLWQSGTRRC